MSCVGIPNLNNKLEFIRPDWSVPTRVQAVSTTRQGGVSEVPWDTFNLADHVADAPSAVNENRRRLVESLHLPAAPNWLQQLHGGSVAVDRWAPACVGDAAYTRRAGVVCAVLTADCLPLLICDRAGTQIAATHAGWRGLAAGVVEATLERFAGDRSNIQVWLGPAIGPAAFEVGDDVYMAFTMTDPAARGAFVKCGSKRWLADLYELARQRLRSAGVTRVSGGNWCTYADPKRFYSYRRDGKTGRMASLIWLTEPDD